MLQQYQPFLHEEFRKLNLEIVPHGYLSTLVAKPTLEDEIKLPKGVHEVFTGSRRTLLAELLNVSP